MSLVRRHVKAVLGVGEGKIPRLLLSVRTASFAFQTEGQSAWGTQLILKTSGDRQAPRLTASNITRSFFSKKDGQYDLSVLFIDIEIKRDGSMRRSFSSGDAVRIILGAAPVYAEEMVGRIFLYVFEGHFIEVTYRAKEFKHLTGVGTKLSAKDFYRLALSGKLTPKQVYFDSRHPAELCERKMRHLQKISDIVNSDILVLEELGTASKVYKFGFTELGFTLCLDKDFDGGGRPRSDYYIVHSLRDGDCFSKSLRQYECNFVFSKRNDRALYDTLNFSDGKADISCLPGEIKERLAPELK